MGGLNSAASRRTRSLSVEIHIDVKTCAEFCDLCERESRDKTIWRGFVRANMHNPAYCRLRVESANGIKVRSQPIEKSAKVGIGGDFVLVNFGG